MTRLSFLLLTAVAISTAAAAPVLTLADFINPDVVDQMKFPIDVPETPREPFFVKDKPHANEKFNIPNRASRARAAEENIYATAPPLPHVEHTEHVEHTQHSSVPVPRQLHLDSSAPSPTGYMEIYSEEHQGNIFVPYTYSGNHHYLND